MKMYPSLFIAALCAGIASGQIERPQFAWLLDAEGSLRALSGTASAAIVGLPVAGNIHSLACFPQVCFAKADTAIYSSSGASSDAPEGPALFATGAGGTYVYFFETGQVMKWTPDGLIALPFSAGSEILSLRSTSDGFDYAVARDGGTWTEHFSESDGSVAVTSFLGNTGPVLLLNSDGTESSPAPLALIATGDDLRLVRTDNPAGPQTLIFNIPNAGAMFYAGQSIVQINTRDATHLLQIKSVCVEPECESIAAVETAVLPPVSSYPRPAPKPEKTDDGTGNANSASEEAPQ